MYLLDELLNLPVGMMLDQENASYSSPVDAEAVPDAETRHESVLSRPIVPGPKGPPQEIVKSIARRWHGSIKDRYNNVAIVADTLELHAEEWSVPAEMLEKLPAWRDKLIELIDFCKRPEGSHASRIERNSLLALAVAYCTRKVKYWATGQLSAGVMTVDDLHGLCFLLPGEGGSRRRSEATDALSDAKVGVVNADFIRVSVCQSAGDSPVKAASGWPRGVRQALIVVFSGDGKKEVLRQLTSRLFTDIRMPAGSHGKQFIIQSAFLKHVDDDPRFGRQMSFSMPRTTIDLLTSLKERYQAEIDAHLLAIEQHNMEIDRLRAEMVGMR
jgi:CheY-like chemotaxis protein